MFAHHQFRFLTADILGVHNLKGVLAFKKSMLVDAGFMRESVFSYNGFVALHEEAGQTADQLATCLYMFGLDSRVHTAKKIFSGFNSHDDFFHGGVSGPFANAVDSAFHLPCPRLHRRKGIGYREPEVVMAMHTDNGLVNIRNICFQIPDEFSEFFRNGVPHGVGNIDRSGAGADNLPCYLGEKIFFRPGRVHGGEFHIVAIFACEPDGFHSHFDDFFLGFLNHMLAMGFGRGQKNVNTR